MRKIVKRLMKLCKRIKQLMLMKGGQLKKAFSKGVNWIGVNFCRTFINVSNENKIVFQSRPDFSDNARSLFEYMIANGLNEKYKIVWIVMNPDDFADISVKNVKFVKYIKNHSKTTAAYYHVLSAKYVFFTHAMRWVEKKTKNQIYINLWHGCGFKDARGEEGKTNVFDFVLVPGPVFIESKSRFFGCDKSKILPIGYPRYDEFNLDGSKSIAFLKNYPEGRRNVIWMPTFRDSEQLLDYSDPIPFIIGLPLIHSVSEFMQLDKMCERNNINLIIKWHRNSGACKNLSHIAKNIFFVTNEDLSRNGVFLYSLLKYTDALITDYSSVSIDYMLLNKPICYTLDDLEDYKRTRGFVFEHPEDYMPGQHIIKLEQLEVFFGNITRNEDPFSDRRREIMPLIQNPTDDYCKRILDEFKIS